MKKLSALALAAAFALAGFAPIASVEAATMKKPAASHTMAMKTKAKNPDLICHKVKEKDGKIIAISGAPAQPSPKARDYFESR